MYRNISALVYLIHMYIFVILVGIALFYNTLPISLNVALIFFFPSCYCGHIFEIHALESMKKRYITYGMYCVGYCMVLNVINMFRKW